MSVTWRSPANVRQATEHGFHSLSELDSINATNADDVDQSIKSSKEVAEVEENESESFYMSPNVSSVADQLQVAARRNKCSTFAAADIRRALRLARRRQERSTKLAGDQTCGLEFKISNGGGDNNGCGWRPSSPRVNCDKDEVLLQETDLFKNGTHLPASFGPVKNVESEKANSQASLAKNKSNFDWRNLLKNKGKLIQANRAMNSGQQVEQQTISATIHSIQTLSLQLDRAASLGTFNCAHHPHHLDHQLEAPSIMSHHQPLEVDSSASLGHQDQQENLLMSTNKIGRLVGKKASRLKEVLLQNFGRADKTSDELFEMYEENFHKQLSQANKLTKEFRQYMTALKGFHDASRSLNKCILAATSDYQTARHDLVCENLSQLEQLNEDLVEKLRDQVMQTVGEYLTQFSELKEKIAKRKRKLIDFDASKRLYEMTLAQVNKRRFKQQQPNESNESHGFGLKFLAQHHQHQSQSSESLAASQLVDEARLLKLREQFNYCKIMYETINSELHEELPIIYEKKMKSLLMTLQSYFALEAYYHSNAGKLLATASDAVEEIPSMLHCSNGSNRDGHQQQQRHDYEDGGAFVQGGSTKIISQDGGVVSANGGGSSSGLGSSHADSSSCPETSSSSAASGAGSPDSGAAAAARIEQQNVSGKANRSAGGEHFAADHYATTEPSNPAYGDFFDEQKKEEQQVLENEYLVVEEGHCLKNGEAVIEDCGSNKTTTTHENELEQQQQQQQQGEQVPIQSEQAQSAETAESQDGPCEEPESEEEGKIDDVQFAEHHQEAAAAETGQDGSSHVEDENQEELRQDEEKSIGFLYKVRTNYKYLAEDVDELCFEADEVIQVIEFDECHEPEDGWLMGIRELNGQRGLFPANFTKPI